jgi:uncharacterized protein YodC (DUF2158 family)
MENTKYEKKEKVFFATGDLVELKKELPNKPVMMVSSVDKTTMTDNGGAPILLGVTCIWFTTGKEIQKARFNTKDLQRVNV